MLTNESENVIHYGSAIPVRVLDNGDEGSISSSDSSSEHRRYDWRVYAPKDGSFWHYFRWIIVGGNKHAERPNAKVYQQLADLAQVIHGLRQYLEEYGMPEGGGISSQEMILRDILRDLYAGGAPVWALDSIMAKVAEGLTGNKQTNLMLFPRKAFIYAPATGDLPMFSSMFTITRGFDISRMDEMENVAVKLASFASNTSGVGSIPARFPEPPELKDAHRRGSVRDMAPTAEMLARRILSLASRSEGLFFFLNSQGYVKSTEDSKVDDFWTVSPRERELFTRLATMDAIHMVSEIRAKRKTRYSTSIITIFRVLASAGACGFWFQGSWEDMLVAGCLAAFIAWIAESSILTKQEKIVYESVASFIVGLVSGVIALTWPAHTCFGAMAISGVLDILQGFRVVYAIIELMSKHTVTGGADFLEGILFTGLIAYFLQIGQYCATVVMGKVGSEFSTCSSGIDPYWYLLLVPLASLSWSGLFTPRKRDLVPMMLHGCLAYGVNYGLSRTSAGTNVNNFVSACAITTSAGITSRFTGRQAVGNTVAGLYVLLPGAYLVNSIFYATALDNVFFFEIVQKSVIIGIGAWTGSVLCSPTLLGTTSGLMHQNQHRSMRDDSWAPTGITMLSF